MKHNRLAYVLLMAGAGVLFATAQTLARPTARQKKPPSEQTIPELIETLGKDQGTAECAGGSAAAEDACNDAWSEHYDAITALQKMGAAAAPAAPALIKDLQGDKYASAAATALGEIKDPSSIPALIAAIETPGASAAAIEALGNYGPAAAAAVCPIINALGQDEPVNAAGLNARKRVAADIALRSIGSARNEDLTLLTKLLSNKNYNVRKKALQALRELRRAAAPAAPAIASLLNDTDRNIRQVAVAALFDIECPSKELVSYVAPVLKDEYEYARATAARALSYCGRASWPARTLLMDATKDESPQVRWYARSALIELNARLSARDIFPGRRLEWTNEEFEKTSIFQKHEKREEK